MKPPRAAALICALFVAGVGAQQRAHLDEFALRKSVKNIVQPVYPDESVRRGSSGVAVADLDIGPDGRVKAATILQAPDEATGKSVVEALRQWTFGTTTLKGSTSPLEILGKVTFYFAIVGGRGKVMSPAEKSATLPPPRSPGTLKEMHEATAAAVLSAKDTWVLDIRDRTDFDALHRPGALNIPFDELVSRARNELTGRLAVVVDCTSYASGVCRSAATQLRELGFNVTLLFR
jgi:TonB family protein